MEKPGAGEPNGVGSACRLEATEAREDPDPVGDGALGRVQRQGDPPQRTNGHGFRVVRRDLPRPSHGLVVPGDADEGLADLWVGHLEIYGNGAAPARDESERTLDAPGPATRYAKPELTARALQLRPRRGAPEPKVIVGRG